MPVEQATFDLSPRYDRELPTITEAGAAAEQTSLDFDAQRPPRLASVICAVCDTPARIPILADGKLCDGCRATLDQCAAAIDASLERADAAYTATQIAMEQAADAATDQDVARYHAAVELQRTLTHAGRHFSAAQARAAWSKALSAGDGLSALLTAHEARASVDEVRSQTRAHAAYALAELAAAKR